MDRPDYTKEELWVMHGMAHGCTREQIAKSIPSPRSAGQFNGDVKHASPSTVARLARSAADKTGCDSIVHAVAVMVAHAWISVDHAEQKHTAQETAVEWLTTRIMSCVDWREFVELRTAYAKMTTEEQP